MTSPLAQAMDGKLLMVPSNLNLTLSNLVSNYCLSGFLEYSLLKPSTGSPIVSAARIAFAGRIPQGEFQRPG